MTSYETRTVMSTWYLDREIDGSGNTLESFIFKQQDEALVFERCY